MCVCVCVWVNEWFGCVVLMGLLAGLKGVRRASSPMLPPAMSRVDGGGGSLAGRELILFRV